VVLLNDLPMAQPSNSPHAQLTSLQKPEPEGAGFHSQRRDKKIFKTTLQVTSTALLTHKGESSTAGPGPYRLYKRRWIGVFAMVNSFQLSSFPWV
jgi:hypothetical protein